MDGMDINTRLEKLERENRRMKKAGIVAIVFASVLFISGQAKTNKVVEANEFQVLDASGKVRADLSSRGGPELHFYDDTGTPVVTLTLVPFGPSLYLGKTGTRDSVSLQAGTSDWPNRSLSLGTGTDSILLHAGTYNSISLSGSAGVFLVNADEALGGPRVTVTDKEGYSGVLGRSDLVVTATGKKEQTPAASLVLFDKDKKVLWAAP